MKKILKALITLVMIYTLYFIFNTPVAGQYGQYGQPTPSYAILVDKMVGKPSLTKGGSTDYEYVDNLSPTDPRFRPAQQIFFKIKIKNTSNVKLTNVVLKDFLPNYIEPIEGPGNYDASTRTITYNAGDFAPDEEKVYYIKAQIFPQDQLPADRGLFCLINRATASANQASDDDSSQFCIEKEVLGAAKVPSAGPQLGVLLLAGQLTTLGLGMLLKKSVK